MQVATAVNRRAIRDMTVSLEAALRSLGGARIQKDVERWPSRRYQQDPVAFAREVLGVEPWERQIEILEAIRDHKKVAIRSGHKVSKSHSLAIAALWFFSSFEDARVVCTCVTARQVDEVFYRECRLLHRHAKVRLDGEPRELARSGIKAPDMREIVGFTAKEAEAVAGVSGKNLLYLVDEASGVPDAIFEAIQGNRAGGARIVMTSNPTRTEGVFFEAFEPKSTWKQLHISSLESPNVKAGREVIPNLAGLDWVDEMARDYGRDSAIFKVRVEGEFVRNETKKIFSLHLLKEAEDRWASTPAEGRLFIGLDPAGPGEQGDETTMSPRRGLKQLDLLAFTGLTADAILVHLLDVIGKHRRPREQCPVIVVDRTGPLGDRVVQRLYAYLEDHPGAFFIVAVRANVPAKRQPHIYTTVRDELLANLETWMREGGAILADANQTKELHAPEWHAASSYGSNASKLKATDKKQIRQQLGRSTDRADALALSTWEPQAVQEQATSEPNDAPFEPHGLGESSAHRQGPSPYNSPMYGGRRR